MDGGSTWEPTIDINADVHEVRGHPADPSLIAAASAVGLCISRDGGATWTIESEGLHATHCSAVAFSGDEILVSASIDPFTAEGKLYRRAIAVEGRIVAVHDGLPETKGSADTSCVATSGAMVVLVDRAGTMYLSLEYGRAWSRIGVLPASRSSVLIC
jgi:hypothetical protein